MDKDSKKETAMELGLELMPEERFARQTADDYWQKFLKTGSVEAYMNYRAKIKVREEL